MKKRFFLPVTVIVLLIFAGILAGVRKSVPSNERLNPVGDTAPSAVGSTQPAFTTTEFPADYDRLWEILEENYYYFPHLEKQGVDIEALKQSTRKQVATRITDVDGFYYLLQYMFRRMQNFAHLDVVDPPCFAVMQKYYNSEASPDNGWHRVLQNPKAQALYAYLEEAGKAQSTGAERENMFPEIGISYDDLRNILIFRIASFDDCILERDRDFIRKYPESSEDIRISHIIFDISGNGGGSDFYWQDNIVKPFGGSHEWTTSCYLRDTELMRDYFFQNYNINPCHASQVGSLKENDSSISD